MSEVAVAPTTLSQAVSFVGALSEEQFSEMQAAIRGQHSFEVSKVDRSRLSGVLSLPDDGVSYVLRVLGFLYNQIEPRRDERREVFAGKLEGVLNRTGAEISDEIKKRFSLLLAFSENHETHLKIERLGAGFIASVRSVQTFLDLRPNFSDSRTSIDGVVPVIQMNIITDSPRNHEASIVFQMDMNGLVELKKAIDDIDAKIAAIKSNDSVNTLKLLLPE